MKELRPKAGVGVLILDGTKTLLAKRQGSHGAGLWGSAGGHLEHMESFADCAKRETKEELGIEIDNIRFLCVINFKEHAPKHFVDIGLVADYKSGEPTIMEPEKCSEIGWFEIDDLPEPLFEVHKLYLESYKTGKSYFDA